MLWVKADSQASLTSGFVAIAGELNLAQHDANQAVAAVKRWLEENTGWLLVFDNADAEAIALENRAGAIQAQRENCE